MNVGDVGSPAAPAPGSPQAKLLAASHQLESLFYGQLFQAMRAAIPDGGLIKQDSGEKMFAGMMDDEVAKLASSQTDRGLAGAIYHELSRRLPAAPAATGIATMVSKPEAA
jgi:Rod binding domain-containing protein